MNRQKVEKLRGVVGMNAAQQHFSLDRFFPSKHLQHFVEHYWLISWDLPKGVEHTQQVISHPCVHMTFLPNNSTITGIVTTRFEHTLKGSGNLVGIRFTPAGFYALAQRSQVKMQQITNKTLPIEQFFSLNTQNFEAIILALTEPIQKIQKIEHELFVQMPKLDSNVTKINDIVKQIETDKSILKVSDICHKFNLEERQLQRLFNKYIGIGAKWIINRYRIHEALEQIETNTTMNWSDLALRLGYYDQAHFIKDFKNLLGIAPDGYLKSLEPPLVTTRQT